MTKIERTKLTKMINSMLNTKPLKASEYNGFPFDLEEIIKKQVNLDETKWYNEDNTELPKYQEIKVEKKSPGLLNFIKSSVYQLAP